LNVEKYTSLFTFKHLYLHSENALRIHDTGQQFEIFVPQSQFLTILRNTPTMWENFNVQVGCTSNDHGVYRAYDNVSVIDIFFFFLNLLIITACSITGIVILHALFYNCTS
jgi:hypothetical protein